MAETTSCLCLFFILWFGLQALTNLLTAWSVPAPRYNFALFVYCLIAVLVLLYCCGFLHRA